MLEPILRDADEVALPVIVLGEYRYGIRQSRNRAVYERWLKTCLPDFRLLPITEPTTDGYAEIRHELGRLGRPIPSNDIWIAALARQHGETLVSRDLHFDLVSGLRRIGW